MQQANLFLQGLAMTSELEVTQVQFRKACVGDRCEGPGLLEAAVGSALRGLPSFLLCPRGR